MSDRGERQFLWFLALAVGAGFCWFSIAGQGAVGRLLLLLLGLAVIALSTQRILRLRRRPPRTRRSD